MASASWIMVHEKHCHEGSYIFLHKELVVEEAQRNANYMEMFFFHVIGYPFLQKHIVILKKDVPYYQ
jgi:hypothetical protein